MKRRKAKKYYWIIASVSAVVITIVGLVVFGLSQTQPSSNEPTKLETPKNFEYTMNVTLKKETEHLLSWEIANHATEYKILIKGETDETSIEKEVDKHTQEYNIADFVTKDENYTVSLVALGDEEKYLTSNPTEITFKAETATKGLSYEKLKEGYEVSRGKAGASSRIVMPDTYDCEPIIKITDNAFGAPMSSDPTMKSVRFPSGLQEMGEFAFANCMYLDNVILPETATQIGAQAFRGCSSLKNICLPSELKVLPMNCFMNCDSLKNIALPEKLERIEKGAFSNCSGLKGIDLPETLTYIGACAFQNTTFTKIKIPDSVKYIGDSAFSQEILLGENARGLETFEFSENLRLDFMDENVFHGTKWYEAQPDGYIVFNNMLYRYKGEMPENTEITSFPEGITRIAAGAFYKCKNIVSIVLPDGLEEINKSMFEQCSSLQTIQIPNSVTVIGENAFGDCTSLKEVQLPNGVKKIGANAFAYCESLKEIIFPDGLEEIGDYSFRSCKGLTNVYYKGSMEDWSKITIDEIDAFAYTTVTIYYYSETEPPLNSDGTGYDGNYWYYDENCVPVVWEYNSTEE